MAQFRPVSGEDDYPPFESWSPRLRVGSRLLADAYSSTGVLLLRAGAAIENERQLHRLTQLDVRFGDTLSDEVPIDLDNEVRLEVELSERYLGVTEFKENVRRAKVVKNEIVNDIRDVFDRIESSGKLAVEVAEKAVSTLTEVMLKDPRTFISLAQLKDADAYTYTHSVNASILSIFLAMYSGVHVNVAEIGTAAMLHDIGKIRIPSAILHKPGPLDPEETKIMHSHSQLGADILIDSGGFSDIIIATVLDHHEKTNGTGYPSGKKGENIGHGAKIVAIADVYDALTTDRPYRKAINPRDAMLMMTERMSGGFHSTLLNSFVTAVGYFPVGSQVKLSNGCLAVVLQNHPSDPLRPAVTIVRDANGNDVSSEKATDLREENGIFVQFVNDQHPPIQKAA